MVKLVAVDWFKTKKIILKYGMYMFHRCFISTKPPFKPNAQVNEMKKSTEIIGFPKDKIIMLNFAVRSFSDKRQEILDYMYKLNLKNKT